MGQIMEGKPQFFVLDIGMLRVEEAVNAILLAQVTFEELAINVMGDLPSDLEEVWKVGVLIWFIDDDGWLDGNE